MSLEISHNFVCAIADDSVAEAAGEILPSHWNAPLATSMATGKILGRNTAGTGPIEELTLNNIGAVPLVSSIDTTIKAPTFTFNSPADTFLAGIDTYGVFLPTAGYVYWDLSTNIRAPANGNLVLTNYAENTFGLLQFGGVTSAFPALKRSGTTLQARLADDSGHANLTVGNLTVMGTQTGGGGIPGGADTAIQYNNAGAFGGSSALVLDATTGGLTIDSGSSIGTVQVQRLKVNETGSADFGVVLGRLAGSNGESRRDNVQTWGYNVGPTGKLLSTDHKFSQTIESFYRTSEGIAQLEYYMTYQNAAGTVDIRPFSVTPHLEANFIDIALRANATTIGYSDTTNDWCTFQSTSSSGSLALSENSTLDYTGDNVDWITQDGHLLMGYTGTTGRLFPGASVIHLFASKNLSDTMTVSWGGNSGAGSTRGIRWNPAVGFQYETADGWITFGSITNYQAPFGSLTAGIGPGTWAPDTNRTLHVFGGAGSSQSTSLKIQLGTPGFQNQDPITVVANDGSTYRWKVNLSGQMFGPGLRLDGDTAAIQNYFDPAHQIMLGTDGGIGFSSTVHWYDAADVGLDRNAAGVLEVNNGTKGQFRDLRLRNTIQKPPSSVTPANNGEFVVEATSNTTLTFKLKGTDGTVRSGTITLA